jgi:DNA-binding transcriptional LysR family regulator
MDTNRLKQFCVIAETGSLTKAAQLLHITHSGLSKSMKLLQEELQAVLMQPAGRGLTLTQEGVIAYQRAKALLLQEDKLFSALKPCVEPISYKIGTVEIFIHPLIKELGSAPFKDLKITLLDLEPGNIEMLIADHQLDVGITYAPYPHPDIDIMELGSYRLGCYYANPAFDNVTFAELPFAAPAQGPLNNPLKIRDRDGWAESLYPRNIKYEVNLLSTAIELTMQGYCAIHIPDFVARKINASERRPQSLIEHPFSKDKTSQQRLFILKRRNAPQSKIYKALVDFVKDLTSDFTIEHHS